MIKINWDLNVKEKKRILNLHESATKKQYILKEANGQTKEEYPECVQSFGDPVVINNGVYGIKGTGDWVGYNFGYADANGFGYFYDPNNQKNDNPYFCRGNEIIFGEKKTVTASGKENITNEDNDWNLIKNGEKVIAMGASGPLVKSLQHNLANRGWGGEELKDKIGGVGCADDANKCDGKFGQSTKLAVMDYQNERKINKDGIVGQQFYQFFYDKEAAKPTKPQIKVNPYADQGYLGQQAWERDQKLKTLFGVQNVDWSKYQALYGNQSAVEPPK